MIRAVVFEKKHFFFQEWGMDMFCLLSSWVARSPSQKTGFNECRNPSILESFNSGVLALYAFFHC